MGLKVRSIQTKIRQWEYSAIKSFFKVRYIEKGIDYLEKGVKKMADRVLGPGKFTPRLTREAIEVCETVKTYDARQITITPKGIVILKREKEEVHSLPQCCFSNIFSSGCLYSLCC